MNAGGPRPTEHAIVTALPYLVVGLLLSIPLLAVPRSDEPLAQFVIQLAAVVLLGGLVTVHIADLADAEWFIDTGWSTLQRRFAGVVVLVVIPTGVVALVTLASSAALRFDPSLQFLQLLSALDIAWAAAALYLGLRWWRGITAARIGLIALSVFCVVSVWNYLRVVGFGADGRWLVDGAQMLRLVLPFDVMAAIMAVASVVIGLRRTAAADGAGQ